MTHKVFVYGTLLKGHHNHRLMVGSRFLFEGYTLDSFVVFGVGFPLARPAIITDNPANTGKVRGEVWEVSDEVLASLDRLEGHPTFYKRTLTPINPFPEPRVWMYHWVQGNRVVGETHRPDKEGVLYWPESATRLAKRVG